MQRNYLQELYDRQIQLSDIPSEKHNEAIYLAAVEADFWALQYVPIDKQTPELYQVAIQQNAFAFSLIPEDKRTLLLCRFAVQHYATILRYVPQDNLTSELCLLAVQHNGNALEFVPEKDRTPEICLAGVQQNGDALRFVPKDKQTLEIYLAAVQKTGMALQYIPKDKQTPELYLPAVKQNGWALRFIPEEEQTPELYLAAVQQNGDALNCIPKDKQTPKLYLAAVQQKGEALQYIPKDKQTPELYLVAVQQSGGALQFVPVENRTLEICMVAVQQYDQALQYVPEEQRTPELYLAVVQKNGLALRHIPKDKQTSELYLTAVQQKWWALQYVPEDMRTPDMCLAAAQQNVSALQYVPTMYQSQVIDKLDIKNIIANDYMATHTISDSLGYEEKIDSYLAHVKYIIIARAKEDHEMRDIRLTYAHERKGNTVCLLSDAPKDDLDALLLRLKQVNNTNKLHLVLVDHAQKEATSMNDMYYSHIVDVCKNNPHIEHIELLGCNVAKATMPEEEKKMVEKFSEKMAIKKNLRYGFASALAVSIDDNGFRLRCEKYCNKYKLDGIYILNKKDDGTYQLCNYKTANNVFKKQDIPEKRIRDFNKILENQNKSLPFPKKKGMELIIRGDNKNPLTAKELKSLRALKYEENRFEKAHPKYKHDKKTYPFLAKINANVEDLQDSFLQKIAVAIEKDSDITWDVTIQGPTKALHVDTAKRDFKVTRTHLYPGSYKTSLFASQKENIDYGKLKDERKEEIEAMEKGEVKGKSKAKKIKVTVRGKNH